MAIQARRNPFAYPLFNNDGKPGDCPVTERIADRLLRLPFYYALSPDEQNDVISGLYAFEEWQ